ncbi:putative protease of the Abi (CAAX) family [Sphingomonas jaspsi DSM 18422]|jgi:membrane protease YdiL (CAAX protease family)|uniref:Putative protease of the Abi (CAAX) family n=1 Tax=Sphingomonas jaspsi DSM 18422 TaxID=1123268 RepID=A0A010ZWI3_9SPHN|nr:CPBP family intramembrane glutamic endopeptidase [Sphingomonas jaspsi]EXG83029.1 putative protease of the Abi (CAAX) family [Sphingomonas jaspsi DSM 18422]
MTIAARTRLIAASIAVIAWALITVFGSLAQAGHGSLAELISSRIALATPAAALFLLIVARVAGWLDLGLNPPRPITSVKLFWLLGLYIGVLGTIAALTREIAPTTLLIVAVNTAVVGFSEELAFRGVLWGAARKAMPFWVGVLFVSGFFGGVHVMNALITGELGQAGVQALNAFLSGIAYLALRIRTRSLWPIMIGHWLWDLAVFANVSGAVAPTGTGNSYMGILLVAPIGLYGLWLLRKPEFRHIDDDETARTMPALATKTMKGPFS